MVRRTADTLALIAMALFAAGLLWPRGNEYRGLELIGYAMIPAFVSLLFYAADAMKNWEDRS